MTPLQFLFPKPATQDNLSEISTDIARDRVNDGGFAD